MNEVEKLINNLYGEGTIGFTCDSCGRELNGCSIVNGMKFCAKCYQETFGKDNQQNEIQQLKQQLEEKDKEIKSLIADYEKRISQEQELMSNMEHRLVEKQNTIDEINKEFVQAVHDWKTLCAEKDKELSKYKSYKTDDERIKDLTNLYSQYAEENKQLKQQLEESFTQEDVEGLIEDREKTIKFLQKELAEKTAKLEFANKEIERLKVFEKAYYFNQTQASQESMDLLLQNAYQVHNEIQLAIQELEKTKDLLLNESKNNPIIYDVNDDLVGGAIDKDAVFKIIDQQIKELRRE